MGVICESQCFGYRIDSVESNNGSEDLFIAELVLFVSETQHGRFLEESVSFDGIATEQQHSPYRTLADIDQAPREFALPNIDEWATTSFSSNPSPTGSARAAPTNFSVNSAAILRSRMMRFADTHAWPAFPNSQLIAS